MWITQQTATLSLSFPILAASVPQLRSSTTTMPTSGVLTGNPEDSVASSRLLGSIGPNPSSKRGNSILSKTYKQAKDLFLQRRFAEALRTLEPIINPIRQEDEGQSGGEYGSPAPVASASKTLRVKVWNLYISLLNRIIDLGLEEGKNQFGSQQWRGLAAKARDGTIWEDVVVAGYHGKEGNVDADVVSELYE
jgi:hypothetical protein